MLTAGKKCGQKAARGTTSSEVGRLPVRRSACQEKKLEEAISHIAKIVK
jgi:hypothetical protein